MSDWTGITGNPAKIALSLVTICFDASFRYCDIFHSPSFILACDPFWPFPFVCVVVVQIIFIVQHYVLFPDIERSSSYSPLPSVESMDISGMCLDDIIIQSWSEDRPIQPSLLWVFYENDRIPNLWLYQLNGRKLTVRRILSITCDAHGIVADKILPMLAYVSSRARKWVILVHTMYM